MENYSDDNCICRAELVNQDCPRHKQLFKDTKKIYKLMFSGLKNG